jgi:hypothetical protein
MDNIYMEQALQQSQRYAQNAANQQGLQQSQFATQYNQGLGGYAQLTGALGWSNGSTTTASSTQNISCGTFYPGQIITCSVPEAKTEKKAKKMSNLEWLDHRVNEMRVCLN